jgi:hypothetical protein
VSKLPKKISLSVLAGAVMVSQTAGDVGLYCSADDLCRPEVADLAHVHQQERSQWDPAPQLTVAVQTSTMTGSIGGAMSMRGVLTITPVGS